MSIENGTAFLVIEKCPHGVRIRRSSRYGRNLNRFWPIWARELILKADVKYQLKISIGTDDMTVASPKPPEEWVGALGHLLAQIVPMPIPPIERNERGFRGIRWSVNEDADLEDVVKKIRLPDAAARHFKVEGGVYYIFLAVAGTGRNQRVINPREVALMVELEIARACKNGYPANTYVECQVPSWQFDPSPYQ
jgi:hypothetical protein